MPQNLSVLHVLDHHRPKIMFSGDMRCHDSIRIPSLAYFAGQGSAALDNPRARLPKRTLELDSFPMCNNTAGIMVSRRSVGDGMLSNDTTIHSNYSWLIYSECLLNDSTTSQTQGSLISPRAIWIGCGRKSMDGRRRRIAGHPKEA